MIWQTQKMNENGELTAKTKLKCHFCSRMWENWMVKQQKTAKISGVAGAGAGGKSGPETSDREISADVSGKEGQGKYRKCSRKKGK